MKGKRVFTVLAWLLFSVYIAGLVYFLFFCESFGRHLSENYRYNLMPFSEIKRYIDNYNVIGFDLCVLNLAGNVIAFVPFGIVVPVLGKYKNGFVTVLIYGLLFTFSVEAIQLLYKVGSFDVDDMILNITGVITGYCIYLMLKRRHK